MLLVDAHCEKCGAYYPKSIREDKRLLECAKCNDESKYVWEIDERYYNF